MGRVVSRHGINGTGPERGTQGGDIGWQNVTYDGPPPRDLPKR